MSARAARIQTERERENGSARARARARLCVCPYVREGALSKAKILLTKWNMSRGSVCTATTPHLQAAADRLSLRLRLTRSRPASCDAFGPSKVLLQRHQTLDTAGDSAARACCTVHPLRQLTYTKLVTETVAEMATVVVQLRTARHTAVNRIEPRTHVV